jgi:hypothetical protein
MQHWRKRIIWWRWVAYFLSKKKKPAVQDPLWFMTPRVTELFRVHCYCLYPKRRKKRIQSSLFICGLFNAANISDYIVWNDSLIMNWKGYVMKRSWRIKGAILVFPWNEWGKPRKFWISLISVVTEIRNWHIWDTRLGWLALLTQNQYPTFRYCFSTIMVSPVLKYVFM